MNKLKFLGNVIQDPDEFAKKSFGYDSDEEAKVVLKEYLETHFVGDPKPDHWSSAEELKTQGIVGVYEVIS